MILSWVFGLMLAIGALSTQGLDLIADHDIGIREHRAAFQTELQTQAEHDLAARTRRAESDRS